MSRCILKSGERVSVGERTAIDLRIRRIGDPAGARTLSGLGWVDRSTGLERILSEGSSFFSARCGLAESEPSKPSGPTECLPSPSGPGRQRRYPGGIAASRRRSAQRHLRTARWVLFSYPKFSSLPLRPMHHLRVTIGTPAPFRVEEVGKDANAISRKHASHATGSRRATCPCERRPLLGSLARPSPALRCKPRFDLSGALQKPRKSPFGSRDGSVSLC
ncbi:hypothetical protein Enr13x_01970 [Stieleria neptunia]|uniref:Uncharacterized protein n=1 Tax=Stieleria neptunia TaxID=2527979 RepID=A0A518HHR9_9BACT|nr:hypothetical protein Enr13x_01970 [Stieleria neptunia]